jgi:hypothetical protein
MDKTCNKRVKDKGINIFYGKRTEEDETWETEM